jgi:hypothetical protein
VTTSNKSPAQPVAYHTLYPRWAQDLLRQAAAIDPHLPVGESLPRRIAIDKALARIRKEFPQMFRD